MFAHRQRWTLAIILHDQRECDVAFRFNANACLAVDGRGFDGMAQQAAQGNTYLRRVSLNAEFAVQFAVDQTNFPFLGKRF